MILKTSCEILSEVIQKSRWLLTSNSFLPVSFLILSLKKKKKKNYYDMICSEQTCWLEFISLLSSRYLTFFDYFFRFSAYKVCLNILCFFLSFFLNKSTMFSLSFTSPYGKTLKLFHLALYLRWNLCSSATLKSFKYRFTCALARLIWDLKFLILVLMVLTHLSILVNTITKSALG